MCQPWHIPPQTGDLIYMKITTTDKLPELNIAGLNRILQIKPDVSSETHKEIHDARK